MDTHEISLVTSGPVSAGHTAPPGFPECQERIDRTLAWLERRGHEVSVPSSVAAGRASQRARDLATVVHAPEYVERFEKAVAALGDGWATIDTPDNPLARGTAAAAWAAVDTALEAGESVLEGTARAAFSIARPPGHHCEVDRAMGFCYLNQVAVLAQMCLDEGMERVAIVDFDVHHGNGTQHLFEDRADVLYASLHQWPFYPGTGAASETGRGAGEGTTLNVPLPAQSGDDVYRAAFEQQVLPAVERYNPDVLLVSAGFDAWQKDPLGQMRVTEAGFESWCRWLAELADKQCDGRLVAVLEGGYDLENLGSLVEAAIRGLAGQKARPL